MAQRTCTVDGCERKHVARGLCVTHYNRTRYTHEQRHPTVTITCAQCGAACVKRKDERRFANQFCSYDCRTTWRRANGGAGKPKTRCALPADHPVRLEIKRQREAARKPSKPKPRPFAWRTARECPGCGCMFSPLYTPNMLTCSTRCSRRVHRWRRRAAEVNAPGSWIWSDFMRIAHRFDFRCAYCGEKPDGQLDPDHVVPLSRGGYNSSANLLPACRACNGDKRDLLLSEWNDDRERRGLPPRMTSWAPEDRRFRHLTQAILVAA